MTGPKTNERPGTRAVLRHYRMSAYKARQVLDLIRGQEVDRAFDMLAATPREGARVTAKVLTSAVANARNNDGLDPDELYVSACYADEGTTLKRWRPRARGRATRIRKRTCHITVIVSRLPDDRLARRRARAAATAGVMRSRRVAASRRDERAAARAESADAEAVAEAPGLEDEFDEGVELGAIDAGDEEGELDVADETGADAEATGADAEESADAEDRAEDRAEGEAGAGSAEEEND
ncbi:MAG: 50S ribosomal protein L22 [Acidimicrobiales bacterium]